ncbi:DNA replication and repair protein recF [Rickettsiales bacterium Ac37b]|nr:DNA replication and repair protein recF [Rickettsiales bacterium Ac37b]
MNNILAINKLVLKNFRNHNDLNWNLTEKPIVITGKNGAGKTNILEAVSLLAPGRGMRNAKLTELDQYLTNDEQKIKNWSIESIAASSFGITEIITHRAYSDLENSNKRVIKVNDKPLKQQSELTKLLNIIWLIPQMDYLFLSGSSTRRKFFDRLVFNFFPDHAEYLTNYENAMRERAKLLKENRYDNYWLNALEHTMAETGVAIASARVQVLEYLKSYMKRLNSCFPKALLDISGTLETAIVKISATALEENFRAELSSARSLDVLSGRTTTGIHRSDLLVYHEEKNIEASSCSTGEQKALLISIILALVKAKIELFASVPILLLDEIVAHLDDIRKEALFVELLDLKTQVWMTSTKANIFESLKNNAQFIEL